MPQFNRRRFLGLAASAGAMTMFGESRPTAAASSTAMLIVNDGTGHATVVVDAAASDTVVGAAEEIVAYIAKSSGVTLPLAPLTTDPPPTGHTTVYVGVAGPGSCPGIPGQILNLDRDGFLIAPYGNTITIIGPSDWGTLNGAHEFLERYVGVRWLLPGNLGEDVPARTTITVPAGLVRQQPGFAGRQMSPLVGNPTAGGVNQLGNEWAQRNRLQGTHNSSIAFHHNLYTLFPVEEFGITHPEYYPNGNPPSAGVKTGWQPVFTEPGTITVAVTKIKQYFASNPEATSFSLGVNDGAGFAEPNPVTPYYQWVNAVVSEVLADYPGKWFGLLAYGAVDSPPPFSLNAAVVPFLTQDRFAWADSSVKATSQARIALWLTTAAQLGLYDYFYGTPYLLPRVYPHLAAETYSYSKQNGIIAQYAELYPNWGEGPKPWMLAKLQWDPTRNVDLLLDEWYECAVGPDAAPYLAQYYAHWEQFWTQRVPGSTWFRPGNTIQGYASSSYLELVSDSEISQSRALIDNVVALADTQPQIDRATVLAKQFEYYEASALSYPRAVTPPTDQASASSLLQNSVDTIESNLTLAARRMQLIQEFNADPVLRHPLPPTQFPALLWSGWKVGEFWALVEYLKANEPNGGPVTNLALQLETSHPTAGGRTFAGKIVPAVTSPSLLTNGSFEEPAAGNTSEAPPWALHKIGGGDRAIQRVTDTSAHGTASMLVTGSGWGGVRQLISAQSGLMHMTVRYRAPAGASAEIRFGCDLLNSSGTRIGIVHSPISTVDPSGSWTSLTLDGEIPVSVRGVPVTDLGVLVALEGSNLSVNLDAVNLYITPTPAT